MNIQDSRYCLMVLALLLSFSAARGAIDYVDGGAGDDSRAGTGGWSDALQTITNALAKASVGSEIWVKSGIYKPSVDDRERSFEMKHGVDLYGGFAGTETSRDQRDWDANPTILSGELGDPGMMDDNSRHVVIGATARLDGFTVCNGFAMHYSSSPSILNQGAGMYTYKAFPVVANCVFRDNIGYYGGAIATTNAHLRLSHVTAYTNSSLNAAHGGALSHDGTGTPRDCLVDNSIFWGNGANEILPSEGVVCRYSDIAGGFAGEGNRNADPRFADARYLHLSSRTSVRNGKVK